MSHLQISSCSGSRSFLCQDNINLIKSTWFANRPMNSSYIVKYGFSERYVHKNIFWKMSTISYTFLATIYFYKLPALHLVCLHSKGIHNLRWTCMQVARYTPRYKKHKSLQDTISPYQSDSNNVICKSVLKLDIPPMFPKKERSMVDRIGDLSKLSNRQNWPCCS